MGEMGEIDLATSLLENLVSELREIENSMNDLLDVSKIQHIHNDPNDIFVYIGPERYWGGLNDVGLSKQAKVWKAFNLWYEIFIYLFSDKPDSVKSEIEILGTSVKNWIDQDECLSWSVPQSIAEAKREMHSKFEEFRKHADRLRPTGEQGFILIPDTNSLIRNPDIHTYGKNIETEKFTVILIPTVLAELDDLKMSRREEDFRRKIESVIRRIKGFRRQGSLHEGVTIHRTIKVKMVANEPRMEEVLQWLDKDVPDDRIVASSLEIQRQNVGATVVLVTSDINLQSKAEAAKLPYIETPIQWEQPTTSL